MNIFDPAKAEEKIRLYEAEAAKEDFWQDAVRARSVTSSLSQIKDDLAEWEALTNEHEELSVIGDLLKVETDQDLETELGQRLTALEKTVETAEIQSLFSDKFDSSEAVLVIHPGAGGTESQDWAAMLVRMYLRWAEAQGFKTAVQDNTPGDEAGIKSAMFTITGKYAYGLLKAEKGVHRLVRISPFDASKRRHTSFASVDVIPAIDDEVEVVIGPKDLRIETYRASGPGGQHVNVTDSAVRITHLPSGTVVQCQNERSQLQNRETAMRILKSRLYELEEEKQKKELANLGGAKREIAWGSQIRSYVLHPYLMVKDHRTGVERGDAQRVLDGDINDLLYAYHHWVRKEGASSARR